MDGNNFNNEFDQELDTKKNDTYDFAYDDYEEYNPQSGSNGMAITGMVIGICALVFYWLGSCCTPFLGGGLALVLGAAGLVFSIIAMKKQQSKGMSIAGLICSIMGVLMGIGTLVAMTLVVGGLISLEFLLAGTSSY